MFTRIRRINKKRVLRTIILCVYILWYRRCRFKEIKIFHFSGHDTFNSLPGNFIDIWKYGNLILGK